MKTYHRSIPRCVVLFALAFGLVIVASGIARADSIAYNVLGTFSNGQQLSGQITWNSASNSVTSSTLSLSSSTFSAACSSPSRGCGAVFAGFWGAGALAKSYEVLLGAFLPHSSLFALTVAGNGGIRIMATNVSWARVAVPEESILAELLILLMGFVWLAKSGVVSRFRELAA
jgi:hypothetical protein